MTREEFESLLEEAFIEGYNNAMDEVEEILNEDYIDIEDDIDSYNEESGHHRNYERKFPIGGFKHAHTKDLGKRLAKEARKAGVHVYDPKRAASEINDDPKKREAIEKLQAKFAKHPANKYLEKNADKLMDYSNKQYDKFKQGKLKDLKQRLGFNAVRNLRRSYGVDD